MPTLIFIDPAGNEHRVDAKLGQSVMQAAVGAMVPGIEAACGGNCVCATCHSYIDERWLSKIAPPNEIEREMLECTQDPLHNSRLTCQLPVTEQLDGLVIRVAHSQH